jgi:hypothetical protein
MGSTRVAIAGVSSEVGVTTLLCELLKKLPGWEAIKMTRDPYRLCGRDPHCTSEIIARLKNSILPLGLKHNLPAYAMRDFFKLAARVNSIHSTRTRASENQWS